MTAPSQRLPEEMRMTMYPGASSFSYRHFEARGEQHDLLATVAARYERCHPLDTFEDLVRRARFSKEDKRLLEDWMAAIEGGSRNNSIASRSS